MISLVRTRPFLYITRMHLNNTKLFCSLIQKQTVPKSTLFPYTTLFRSVALMASTKRPISVSVYSAKPANTSICLVNRSEEHTSELQSRRDLVCRLLLEKKNIIDKKHTVSLHYVDAFQEHEVVLFPNPVT